MKIKINMFLKQGSLDQPWGNYLKSPYSMDIIGPHSRLSGPQSLFLCYPEIQMHPTI